MGWESRRGLAKWLWPRVFHEVVVKISAWAVVIWRLDWSWRTASKRVHSHGCQVHIGCSLEASVSHHMDLPRCLSVLMTCSCIHPDECAEREQSGSHNVFDNLALVFTLCHVCDALMVTQVSLPLCGRRPHKSVNTRRWESFWRLPTTHMKK